jgi:hypothetical protein
VGNKWSRGAFFSNCELPEAPFQLNERITSLDFDKFLETEFSKARDCNGNITFEGSLLRLR